MPIRAILSKRKKKDLKETIKVYQKLHSISFNWTAKLGTQLYFLMGSRYNELEADKYGTRLAAEAGRCPLCRSQILEASREYN